MNAVVKLASVENLVRGSFDADAMQSILLEMGVKPTHVRIALERAQLTGEPLSIIMRDFGFLSGEQVAQAISRQTGLKYFGADEVDQIDPADLKDIELPKYRRFVPVGRDGDTLIVAVPDASVVNEAKNQFYPQPTSVVVASEHVVQALYRKYFAKTDIAFDTAIEEFRKSVSGARRGDEEDAGLVRRVFMALLRHACFSGASDLYLYKSERTGLIKLKINGVGQMFRIIEGTLFDRLLNKLVTENKVKVEDLRREPREAIISFDEETAKANEDIAGRFGFRLELSESRGEREAVVRILDKQSPATDLDRLGFDSETLASVKRIAQTATGLFLVTGPTGSGKTTTLYAVLKGIDPVERSVQSIENPIEYRHGLWQQHELSKSSENSSEGDEYNKWLKALLRNAPDVILVGEVRDKGVAQILLDAANTGHLAFSTLHTNNAAMALARLRALNVDMNTLASVLLGILAQRLVRVLCPRCRQVDDSEETATLLKADYLEGRSHAPHKAGEGCEYCDYTGYRGRRMVYELLEVNHELQELIEAGATPSAIARKGIKADRTMWACGLRLVADGVTSLEELRRVAKADI